MGRVVDGDVVSGPGVGSPGGTVELGRERLGAARVAVHHLGQPLAWWLAARGVGRGHQRPTSLRTDQLISASGARRYSGATSHGCCHSSRIACACASCTSDTADGCSSP